MRAYILTEGGKRIGMGHIVRCRSLYDELLKRGLETTFLVNDEWRERDLQFLEGAHCIVDSYMADAETIAQIARYAKRCLFIDDNNIRAYPPGSILCSPSLYGHTLPYQKQEGMICLTGPDYIILRTPFRQSFRRQTQKKIGAVTIIMGGTDPDGRTLLALTALKNMTFIKNAVIHPASPCYRAIQAEQGVRIHENLDAEAMCHLLLASDLVISAGGQTVNELIQTRTPALLVEAADNQRRNIATAVEKGMAFLLDANDLEQSVRAGVAAMDEQTRDSMSRKMTEYDFSQGVRRIIDRFCQA